ncbi:MAG: hypothetical protein J5928_05700 [Firmicutes bacterium]|nr:hypothetical protein [Bacillota bacterium]
MKNIFCYEIANDESDYRIEIIKEGVCKLFFDTSFVEHDGGKLKCYADVSGYSPISSYVEMPIRAALDIIIAIIKGVLSAADRYLLPWDYIISTKTVYADRTGEEVKLIYMPLESRGEISENLGNPSAVIGEFCRGLEAQLSSDDRYRFTEVIELFDKKNLKADECLRVIYALKQDAKTPLDL